MTRVIFKLICVCALCSSLVQLISLSTTRAQQRNQLLLRYEMRNDFQGDGLGQWASYPPAQDVGYEPSISPTSDHGAPGGRALMRVVKPNRAGVQRFGFI